MAHTFTKIVKDEELDNSRYWRTESECAEMIGNGLKKDWHNNCRKMDYHLLDLFILHDALHQMRSMLTKYCMFLYIFLS